MNEFGDAIYKIRTKHKISQEEFADRVGVSRQIVSKWENGDVLPNLSNIWKISDALQIDPNTLLGLRNKVHEENKRVKKYIIKKKVLDCKKEIARELSNPNNETPNNEKDNENNSVYMKGNEGIKEKRGYFSFVIVVLITTVCLVYLSYGLRNLYWLLKIRNGVESSKKLTEYEMKIEYLSGEKEFKKLNVRVKDNKYEISDTKYDSNSKETDNIITKIDLNSYTYETYDVIDNVTLKNDGELNFSVYENGNYIYSLFPDILKNNFLYNVKFIFAPWKLSINRGVESINLICKDYIIEVSDQSHLPFFYCNYKEKEKEPVSIYYSIK